jgi:hypothetical protein
MWHKEAYDAPNALTTYTTSNNAISVLKKPVAYTKLIF